MTQNHPLSLQEIFVKKITLEESKQLQLDILNAFDAFCQKNGLRYMLAYGTLLGAVRHKGFIPWDDDIDLYMPIEDYRKMAVILNREENNGFFNDRYRVAGMLINSTIPYHQTFAKIYDRKTTAEISTLRSDLGFQEGIFIDIFPIAGLPDDNEKRTKIIKSMKHANNMLYWATRKLEFSDFTPAHPRTSLYNFIDWIASHKKPFNQWMADYQDLFEQLPPVEGSAIAAEVKIYLRTGSDKYLCNPWLPATMLEFEGRKYPVPNDYDTVLKRDYGNYMQLPPKEQQQPSHDQDFFLID